MRSIDVQVPPSAGEAVNLGQLSSVSADRDVLHGDSELAESVARVKPGRDVNYTAWSDFVQCSRKRQVRFARNFDVVSIDDMIKEKENEAQGEGA
eukprot:2359112-Rhodomonas_salina.4